MKKEITAIIVDDEEGARDVLNNLLIRFCKNIRIVAKCNNVPDAVIAINKLQPDVVFLDIEMPKYAGYEIVSFFKEINFEIIFITAYDQYAIKAFEVSAVDYLLKPVDVDRLKSAVEKLTEKVESYQMNNNYQVLLESLENKEIKKIVIPHRSEQKILMVSDIYAIQAQESYCTIHYSNNESYVVSKNLKHFEKLLAENSSIFRTHKSWIINVVHLKSYSKTNLEINLSNNIIAKLSKYKKAEFEEFIQ